MKVLRILKHIVPNGSIKYISMETKPLSKKALTKLYSNIKHNAKAGGGGGKYRTALTNSGLTESEVLLKLKQKTIASSEIIKPHLQKIWLKQKGKCCLSGIELNEEYLFTGDQSILAPSIDRINNNKGYEIDNIQIVMRGINRFKNLTKDKEFINILKYTAKSVINKYEL